MKLTNKGLKDIRVWKEAGYAVPEYDRECMIRKTVNEPCWVHFGNGNLFKAFQARAADKMLNEGKMDRGIIVVERTNSAAVKTNRACDQLALSATLKQDGSVEKAVIGSIAESVVMDPADEAEFGRLKEIFEKDSLQMTSFTITEKAYSLTGADGGLLPEVSADFEEGPARPRSYMGKVTALLYHRYKNGAAPIAMVSMDNCSHNGEKLKAAILAYGANWAENEYVEWDFVEYLQDENQVSYPWSMIDKITPRADRRVEQIFVNDGVELPEEAAGAPLPFVNAEETEYLVIEDKFPNGRPALEEAGLMFTDRETVNNVEKMKVTTCLNPLHTALAIFGCLTGYKSIAAEMQDPDLVNLIRTIGYKEGLPVVTHPGILDPKEFIDTVIENRLPNPFIPDAPQRIAMDTSQKLAIRFGETIKSYMKDETLNVSDLKLIPFVFAGWIRYLMGLDDAGVQMELASDPMLSRVQPVVADIALGDLVSKEDLKDILEDEDIFGVSLEKAGMADQVLTYFNQMIAAPGAVRSSLRQALAA